MADNIFSNASAIRMVLTRNIFNVQIYLDEIMFELMERTTFNVEMEGSYIKITLPIGSDLPCIEGIVRDTIVSFFKRNAKLIMNSMMTSIEKYREAYNSLCSYPEWIYDTITTPNALLIRF